MTYFRHGYVETESSKTSCTGYDKSTNKTESCKKRSFGTGKVY